jgi:hypothetical protein
VTILYKNWRGAKLVKDATKKLFSDGIYKKIVKLWNQCLEVVGDYIEN